MSLRIVLLTTDTSHHRYFVKHLAGNRRLSGIFVEPPSAQAPFPTAHPFEKERDEYERSVLLAGDPAAFEDYGPVVTVESWRSAASCKTLAGFEPDILISFGSSRLPEEVLQTPRLVALNLHGGNPEYYRGLDSHLWAIYHRDFSNLITTLHLLDADLDTGPIVFQQSLPLQRNMPIHQLRAVNTKVCVQLCALALQVLEARQPLPTRPQLIRGRYYSAMPAALKDICVAKFSSHVAQL